MKLINIKNVKLNRAMNIAGLRLQKAAPGVLLAAGVISIVGGTILACKATKDAEPVLKNFNANIDKVHATKDSNPKYGRDLTMAYCRGMFSVAKLYLPAIVAETAGIACVIGAHNIQNRRLVQLGAGLSTMTTAYNKLQDRLKEADPELHEKLVYGVGKKPIDIEETNAKGKVIHTKKEVRYIDKDRIISIYGRYFNSSNPNWNKNPMVSLDFIMGQQKTANRMLRDRGYLFLNEVYNLLGVPVTPEGQQVGWIYLEERDMTPINDVNGYVSFGVYNQYIDHGARTLNQDFINGQAQECFLDFNVDGYILDLI